VKRQVRESYRLNKQALLNMLPCDKRLLLAFVWQSDRLSPTEEVESRVKNLLRRMAERL
jgi:ribonuclease P protein component